MAEPETVDQMIEEGLARYGRGDLDGALEVWERVLAMWPGNEQASSYVDYVRQNYEMLTSGDAGDESLSPYAIADDEYTIEIIEGARPDSIDEGWGIDDWNAGGPAVGRVATPAPKAIDPASEATTPSLPIMPPSDETRPDARPFDAAKSDETKPEAAKFEPRPISEGDPLEPVREFESSNTPVGFAQQSTNVRPRDTGFVKPTGELAKAAAAAAAAAASAAAAEEPTKRAPTVTSEESRPRTATAPPELEISIRTPGQGSPAPGDENTQFTRFGPPPSAPGDFELGAAGAAHGAEDPERKATKELASSANIALTSAPTTEIPLAVRKDFEDRRTRDFSKLDTTELPSLARHPSDTGGLTRDLGLRTKPITMSGEIKVRPPAAVSSTAPTTPPPPGFLSADGKLPKPIIPPAVDPTRHDMTTPFDAIEQRAAQILDDIDEGASVNEPKDDRTRRRISALVDHATDWHKVGELAKAVTAVDLALSEDPNSALAQKLIHRNRDTIMSVFQAYLGDLQRAPGLAQPLHELASAPINPRAAFLLSRIDGTLSVDEILDVSGMPRLEAYRHLCQLLLRGIIK